MMLNIQEYRSLSYRAIECMAKAPLIRFGEAWNDLSLVVRKPVFGVSDQVRGCTATEDSKRLEIRFLDVEGLYYPCSENKGADQLRSYCAADLRLCFRICKKPVFSQRGSFVIAWCTCLFEC